MAEKAGMVAALASLEGELGDEAEEAGEQLDLLPSLPDAPGAVARRGPGRPAGSRNKSTEQWRAYLLRRFGSPLEALLQVATCDLDGLVREFGLSKADAFKVQLDALEACLPYLHQKLPQAVEVSGNDGPVLVIGSLQQSVTVNQALGDGSVRLEMGDQAVEGEIVENQGVGAPTDGDV